MRTQMRGWAKGSWMKTQCDEEKRVYDYEKADFYAPFAHSCAPSRLRKSKQTKILHT
jgi:hypothetical protein